MSDGLRILLQLPEAQRIQATNQAEEFGRQFREGIGRLNQRLQLVAAQGGKGDLQPLDAQRVKLCEAYQKASALIDPRDPQKADPAIQRVIAAVAVVDEKASSLPQACRPAAKSG